MILTFFQTIDPRTLFPILNLSKIENLYVWKSKEYELRWD